MTSLELAHSRAVDYERLSSSRNTARAYASRLRAYEQWCALTGAQAYPPSIEVTGAYLAHCADIGRSMVYISHICAALTVVCRMQSWPIPDLALLRKGISRAHGRPPKRKAPITVEQLRAICALPGDTNKRARDRALLLVGFAGAFRRSELGGILVDDCEFSADGVAIMIRHSKTDQTGAGRVVGIPYGTGATCPVEALAKWLLRLPEKTGYVFRGVTQRDVVYSVGSLSGHAINAIVKDNLTEIGVTDVDRYGAHSLRAGLITAAARTGAREVDIMAQSGHTSIEVMRTYIRDGQLFSDNNVARKVGL